MERDTSSTLAEQLAAVQEWWREAGVDCAFADEPASWLESPQSHALAEAPVSAPAAAPAKPQPPPKPMIGGTSASWPTDLTAFVEWWLSEPSLDPGGARPRVPPRGPAGAKVLALVPQPEAEDRERLLSGEQGKLLASFLRNAGVAETEVYVASALPRHTPMPDWRDLRASGLDAVLRHHIELARPERVILFGQDVITLLSHDLPQKAAHSLDFNQQRGSVGALAARSLEHMLRVPSARKRLWQDWLDWTDGNP
jgi:DNA polymerase